MGLGASWWALEPAVRASQTAVRVSELAKKKKRKIKIKKKITERSWYVVVPYVIVPYGAAAQTVLIEGAGGGPHKFTFKRPTAAVCGPDGITT